MSPTRIERMNVDAFMIRVRERCAPHRGGVDGFCALCFRATLEDLLFEEHPEMKRDDVGLLVDAWILAADQPAH